MARKMISINKELFIKLKQFLPREIPAEIPPVSRWVETTFSEKKWLREVKFETDTDLKFGDQKSLALAFLESEIYLISVGLELDLPQDDFDSLPVNAGLFCAALSDLNIEPVGGDNVGLDLLENIFRPAEAGASGISYSLQAVAVFFPKVSFFRINSESPLLKPEANLFQIALFAVTKCPHLITLNWTSIGLENARALCAAQKPFLPFELILRAIIERKHSHAFLELYRCIEYLFPFPKINELREKLALTLPTAELCEHIENILGWRTLEDSALKHLFRTLPADVVFGFQQAFSIEDNSNDLQAKVAERLYKLRNDCVHFRPVQRISTLQATVKWELLLQVMLLAIGYLYENQFQLSIGNIEVTA